MQADQSQVVWTVIIAAAILLVVSLFSVGSINNNLKLIDVDVDEQAIADAVLEGIEVPEYPEFDTEKLDEVWDNIYEGKVNTLEEEAIAEFGNQFLEDNDRDANEWFVKGNEFSEDSEVYELVTEDVECDGDCVVEFVKEYDDMEVEVINLGLDDEDDREVELSTVIRVKVLTDEDDSDEYFFDKVYLDSTITADDEELEAEITYSL